MPSLFESLPAKAGLCVVITALVVVIGVAISSPARHVPKAPADPLAARLASVDTTAMTVRRAGFCSALPDATVAVALGAAVAERTAWKPGERVTLARGVKDVADEYGCSWSATSGASARAWVFAPPVTADRAATLAKEVPNGCAPARAPTAASSTFRSTPTASSSAPSPPVTDRSGALIYGRPTSALTCGDSTMLRGLFGDAWLTCELSSTDVDLVGRWCLAVARAAG